MTVRDPRHTAPTLCYPACCEVAILAGSQVHCLSLCWCNCCWRGLAAALPGGLMPTPAACMVLVAVQQCLLHRGLGAALMGVRRQGQPPSQRGKLPLSHAPACLHKTTNAELTSHQSVQGANQRAATWQCGHLSGLIHCSKAKHVDSPVTDL